MDKVIVTGMLVVGAVTAAAVVIMTIGPSIGSSSSSVLESQGESALRIRTSIEIIAVASNSGGTEVDGFIKNIGVATIDAIEKSDVFLKEDGNRFDAISYNNNGATLTWSGDLEEQGLSWSRGDTLHIEISLSGSDVIDADKDYVLQFFTPNGAKSEKTFSR